MVTMGTTGSMICTVKVQLPWLPPASVATQITLLVPTGKIEPEAGVQTTEGRASQVSVALAAKVITAPPGLVHSTVTFDGQVGMGGTESITVTMTLLLVMEPARLVTATEKLLPESVPRMVSMCRVGAVSPGRTVPSAYH